MFRPDPQADTIRFRALFDRIAAQAGDDCPARRAEAVAMLRAAGFTALRRPGLTGADGMALPTFVGLLIDLAEADGTVAQALLDDLAQTEDHLLHHHGAGSALCHHRDAIRHLFADAVLAGAAAAARESAAGGRAGTGRARALAFAARTATVEAARIVERAFGATPGRPAPGLACRAVRDIFDMLDAPVRTRPVPSPAVRIGA